MADALLARLEAIVIRLEKASGAKSGGSAAQEEILPKYDAYKDFVAVSVAPFIASLKNYPELAAISADVDAAFNNQGAVVRATYACKKPSDQDLLAFLKGSADVIANADKLRPKGTELLQLAWKNVAPAFGWMFAVPPNGLPKACIEGNLEAAEVYLNKLLMGAKDKPSPAKENDRALVKTFKDLWNGFRDYVVANFKTGLEWSPKGTDLKSYKPGAAPSTSTAAASSASSTAPDAPQAPDLDLDDLDIGGTEEKKQPEKKAGGMAAVFGEISKGLSVTAGLKKVTNDMKSKNITAPALEAKSKVVEVKAVAAAPAKKKQPSLTLKQGTWYCENYEGVTLDIPEVETTQSVYISNCLKCRISVAGKAKGLAVDKCNGTTVNLDSILSTLEIFNCDRTTCYVSGVAPTITLDKCKGVIVHLSKTAQEKNPDIISSNISECNIQIPGPSAEVDLIEMPLPEQYLTKLDLGGKKPRLETHTVSHG